MVPSRPLSPASREAAQRDETRAPACQSLVVVAEREFLAVLTKQAPPAFGRYAPPSSTELAALNDAVDAICREAHRLDLRAEEVVIAVKKAWSHLATERTIRLGDRDGDVLREVVTASIERFFDSCDAEGNHLPQ